MFSNTALCAATLKLIDTAAPFCMLHSDLTYIGGTVNAATSMVSFTRANTEADAIHWMCTNSTPIDGSPNGRMADIKAQLFGTGAIATLQKLSDGVVALTTKEGSSLACYINTYPDTPNMIKILTKDSPQLCLTTTDKQNTSFEQYSNATCWNYQIVPLGAPLLTPTKLSCFNECDADMSNVSLLMLATLWVHVAPSLPACAAGFLAGLFVIVVSNVHKKTALLVIMAALLCAFALVVLGLQLHK